jgi:predicted deacylase
VIFSTMVGAVEIARKLPDRVAQEKVLASSRDFSRAASDCFSAVSEDAQLSRPKLLG